MNLGEEHFNKWIPALLPNLHLQAKLTGEMR